MTTPTTAPTPARPTPLSAVLAFSFLNSLGTAVITSGIYFFTSFTKLENFALGAVLGVTYIAAAMAAQPLTGWLGRQHRHLTARGVLVGMMIAMMALCALPLAAARLAPSLHTGAIWVMAGAYSPLTGILWPLVESYLSGGRRGEVLRSSTGLWNVVWSSAGVFAFLCVSPITKIFPNEALMVLGLIHGASAVVLMRFEPEPGEHAPVEHEPHPPVYRALLHTFRVLLPTSYIILATLMPYMPTAMDQLAIPVTWHTAIASTWMASRVGGFFVFHRWPGWHGRWWPATVGGSLVFCGFGLCVMAPWIAGRYPGSTGIACMIAGLALFGIGHALIYSAAIYYALEVGQSEVQAGGKHEALIGAGYTLGPLIGLGASFAESRRWIAPGEFNPIVLGAVGLIAFIAGSVVVSRTLRHSRPLNRG